MLIPYTLRKQFKMENEKMKMDQEIDAIKRNETWELVKLPENRKAIGFKWIYRTKLNQNGEVKKYKVRLVVNGYKKVWYGL